MTDQTSPAATWDVTATVTVTNLSAADGARFALADVVNQIAAAGVATDTAVEMHRNPPASDDPPRLGPYSETLAREIADELDRRRDVAEQRMKDMLLGGQRADGLDDQDGPVTRCRQYAEEDAYGTVVVWAHKPDGTWLAATDVGWRRMAPGHDQPDTPVDELESLGWVEIPIGRQLPAPVASEEPTR